MSIGDNEYGSISYGDDSIIAAIIRLIKDIFAIFFSKAAANIFMSEKSFDTFFSLNKVNIFESKKERILQVFKSRRKDNIFNSIEN